MNTKRSEYIIAALCCSYLESCTCYTVNVKKDHNRVLLLPAQNLKNGVAHRPRH